MVCSNQLSAATDQRHPAHIVLWPFEPYVNESPSPFDSLPCPDASSRFSKDEPMGNVPVRVSAWRRYLTGKLLWNLFAVGLMISKLRARMVGTGQV